MSLSVIGVAAAVVIGGTGAFFSDTETSAGNTFTAGAIDLQIDNDSYYGTDSQGNMLHSDNTTWDLADLDDGNGPSTQDGKYLFFNFHDLKPGDIGEDTISMHINGNDSWACMDFNITSTPENGINEPEAEANDVTENEGELQNEINFVWWVDDGDNVLESDEADGASVISNTSLADLNEFGVAIADSSDDSLSNGPLTGDDTFYIGKAWCYGDLALNPETQDGANDVGPDQRGPGVTCDGSGVSNVSQGDGVTADIEFTAVQWRNNPDFTCSSRQGGGGERPIVGAALSAYSAPSCSATVADDESLQAAIDSASADDTICVASSYTGSGDDAVDYFDVDVTGLTIAGLGNAGDATVSKGLHINANNITVTGLTLNGWSNIESTENAAIYINSGMSHTTISYNKLDNDNGGSPKGIVTEIGNSVATAVSNVTVTHNLLRDWNQAMFFNTTRDYSVTYNDIYANNVGVANDGPHNASIMNNDFEGNGAEAVGVAPAAANGTGNNGSLTVKVNNFAPAGSGNNVNFYGSSVASGADVDAENNWWDGEVENDRTNATSEVDTDPAAASAFPEN